MAKKTTKAQPAGRWRGVRQGGVFKLAFEPAKKVAEPEAVVQPEHAEAAANESVTLAETVVAAPTKTTAKKKAS